MPTETLKQYKERVRAVAIEVAHEEGWCRSGLNERLSELGLAPLNSTFEVVATVQVRLTVEVNNDEAYGEERDYVENLVHDNPTFEVNSWDDDDVTTDSVEVTSITVTPAR